MSQKYFDKYAEKYAELFKYFQLFHAVLSEIDPNKYGDECRNDPSFVQSQLHVPRVMELLQVLQYWTGGTTTEHP